MFWRRLACTAVEDVAPIDVGLVVRALTAHRRMDLHALIKELCVAPKDRSADYLLSIIQYDPDLANVRAGRFQGAAISGEDAEITLNAANIWREAGTNALPGNNLPRVAGNTERVFRNFRQRGVPPMLVDACELALRRLRNPLPLFYPLLWKVITGGKTACRNSSGAIPTTVHGVPLYALGQHCRLGKRAIAAWVENGRRLTLALAQLAVPTACWRQAAELGVFHVESAVIKPELNWNCAERLRNRAVRADFCAIGFPEAAIHDFLEVVAENLPRLDVFRTKVIEREVSLQRNGRQTEWKF